MAGKKLDWPRIAEKRKAGQTKQQIADEMGLSPRAIANSLRSRPHCDEPEADVRARWATLLPAMRERLKADIGAV